MKHQTLICLKRSFLYFSLFRSETKSTATIDEENLELVRDNDTVNSNEKFPKKVPKEL